MEERDHIKQEGSSKSANIVEEGDLKSDDGDMLSVSSSRDHLTDSWIMDFPVLII